MHLHIIQLAWSTPLVPPASQKRAIGILRIETTSRLRYHSSLVLGTQPDGWLAILDQWQLPLWGSSCLLRDSGR